MKQFPTDCELSDEKKPIIFSSARCLSPPPPGKSTVKIYSGLIRDWSRVPTEPSLGPHPDRGPPVGDNRNLWLVRKTSGCCFKRLDWTIWWLRLRVGSWKFLSVKRWTETQRLASSTLTTLKKRDTSKSVWWDVGKKRKRGNCEHYPHATICAVEHFISEPLDRFGGPGSNTGGEVCQTALHRLNAR